MSTKRKFSLIFAAVAVVMLVGAFTASAQSSTDPSLPPFGGMGRGMMIQSRLLWDDDSAPMFSAIADALGIDQQTLSSELQSGKTLAELAQEKGIDLTAVTESAQATIQQHLNDLVAQGVLTQAQADERLSLIQNHWDDMPHLYGSGYGYGYNMMGTGRGGMWSNGSNAGGASGNSNGFAGRGSRMGRGG